MHNYSKFFDLFANRNGCFIKVRKFRGLRVRTYTSLYSDIEKLYETVHPEDLYLYNNGNEYSNGFTFHSNTGWPTGSKTGAYLKVNYPQNSHVSYGNWNFDEGIDLTYYKHIVVQVYVSLNNSLYVGVKCGSLYSTRTITSSGTYTFDLDITSLSGTFVPYFYSENAWAITVAEVHFISMLLTK